MTRPRNLILVVDDNPENLQIAWAILDNAGYEVAILKAGNDVCEFAETEQVSLILLDVMMPDVNGFEVCRRLKANSKTRNIPIIFQTGLAAQEEIVRGFEAGAVDYVVKPYNSQEFLKRVETHLHLRNALVQLEEKNEELTHHFYTISHDLRSPLVTIGSFMHEMKEDYQNADVEQVKVDQRFVEKAIQHMQELLDGLLLVAKAGDRSMALEHLILQELTQEVSLLLGGRIKEYDVELLIPAQSIPIWGDRTKLIQVLQNLIENAIKYRRPKISPKIEVGAIQQGKETVVFVRDNGRGIDVSQRHKVFDVFQQSENKTEGIGLGLFLVKRIIEAHRGKIWVESEGENKGCTFYFTLGLPEENS